MAVAQASVVPGVIFDCPQKGTDMGIPTKRLRVAVAGAVVLGVLGGALLWSRSGSGFATPEDCLSAYYEACQAGDVSRYLACLGEPLRSRSRERLEEGSAGAEALRRLAVRGWARDGSAKPAGEEARLDVEEIRTDGIRRVQFQLERSTRGWLIVALTSLEEKAPLYPYGTDVRSGAPDRSGQP